MDFENKKVSSETLPERLITARERFSYSVHAVSHITGISEKFIEDLEGGHYHRLPAEVYVIGFLRKLGELYKMDSATLIADYRKEREIHQNLHRYSSGQEYGVSRWKTFAVTPKTLIGAVSALLVLGTIAYLGYQVHAVNAAPKITVTAPSNGQVVDSSSLLLTGTVDPGTKLTVNDQTIFVDANGGFKQAISVNPGQNILNFVADSPFNKQSTKQITVIADYQNQTPPAQNAAPISLTVTVGPNATWITVQADNQQPDEETFAAGSSKTYTAQTQIILSTGDAGSTRVSLNGQDLGKLGKDGETIRDIPFTADNVLKSSGN